MHRSATPGKIRESVPLAPLTTLGIGGPARFLQDAREAEDLEESIGWAADQGLPVVVLGEGSNVLAPDDGFPGLVVRCRVSGVAREDAEVVVGGGENLPKLIRWLNQNGLSGMESMYGIPGTVAGAVVGNAGAYGQEIRDCLAEAEVWSRDGVFRLPASRMDLRYRHSVLKERRDWIILRVRLVLRPGGRNLQRVSDAILEKRLQKYPVGLKCPGSFFKNVLFDALPAETQNRVPTDFVMFDKIPAGKLLEAVGACGARRGDAQFAGYHGNLLINRGRATARDILELAAKYGGRVLDRFGIRLEPEILILDPSAAGGGAFWEPSP